jgi:cytochrome c oxidase assembly protein subunit 15
MVGGVFYEHSHRLVASGVGLLTIILAVSLWLNEQRRWVCWLGTVALVLVVVQGVIGGLRVVFIERWLAIVHSAVAQAFFGLLVAIALFTSGRWQRVTQHFNAAGAATVQRLCVLTVTWVYLQVILGAVVRHTGMAVDLHVVVAFLIAVHVFLVARRMFQLDDRTGLLRRPALWLSGLLVVQLMLGVGSYLVRFSAFGSQWSSTVMVALTSAHVVTGALMLGVSLVLTLLAFHVLDSGEQGVAGIALSERAST